MNIVRTIIGAVALLLLASLTQAGEVKGFGPAVEKPKDGPGLVVREVMPRGLADQIGLKPGYLLQKVNARDVNSDTDLGKMMIMGAGEKTELAFVFKDPDGRPINVYSLVYWPSGKESKEESQQYKLNDKKDLTPVVIKKMVK